MKTLEDGNPCLPQSLPFHANMNLSRSIFTYCDRCVLETVCQHSRDIKYVSVQNL